MISKSSDKIWFLLLITLIILPIQGNAATNYKLFTGESKETCPGTTNLIIDRIENIGNQPLSLTISPSGSASGFVTVIPNGMILDPGKSKSIYSYITPRTTTKTGIYSLLVNLASQGDADSIEHRIIVKNCNDFEIVALKDSIEICPSDSNQVRFQLENLGQFDDTYSLSIEGEAKDWITLNSNFLAIESGEKKSITAFIKAPSSAEGKYFFSINAKSQSTSIVKSVEANVVINPCYSFKIDTDKNFVNMCEHTLDAFEIKLKNIGSTENSYKMKTEGPLWANLNKNTVTLDKGEETTLKILLNPDYLVQGSYKIDLSIATIKGDLEGITSFNVNVNKCHDVALIIERDKDIICSSINNDYNVIIKNTGTVEKDFILKIDGPNWAVLDDNQIRIEPDEQRNIDLEIRPSSSVPSGDYKIKIIAEAFDSSKVKAEDELNIQVVSREECFKPNVNIQKDNINVNFDSSATIPILIENKGNNDATYTLSVTGTAVTFTQLNPASLTIESGESEVVFLFISPNSQTPNGNYEATISARLEDSTILATDSIKITVLESKALTTEEEKTLQPNIFTRAWLKIKGLFTREETIEREIENLSFENVTQPNITTQVNITNKTVIPKEIPIEIIEINKTANISVKEIEEVISNESIPQLNDSESNQSPNIFSKYGVTLIIAVIGLLFILIIYKYRNKFANFFEEEIEDEPKLPPKVPEKQQEIEKKDIKKEFTKEEEPEDEIVLGILKDKHDKSGITTKSETTVKKTEPKKRMPRKKTKT